VRQAQLPVRRRGAAESPALVFTEGGRTKTVTLAGAEVAEVEAAVARYAQARAELDQAAAAGISTLRARRAHSRGGRGAQ